MIMQVKPKQDFTLKAPIRPQASKVQTEQKAEAAQGDTFTPGQAQSEAPTKPNFAKSESTSAPKPAELTDNPESDGIGGWQRTLLIGMTGVLGLGALTGCTGGTGTSTNTDTQAMKDLNTQFDAIEKSMKDSGDQSSGQIAGNVLNSIAEYSRATGEKGEQLMDNLAGTIRKRPVLAASLAFAAGSAVGISLDQFGVTDAAMNTAGDVVDWVKENPFKSIAIGVAVAGAGYLLYDNLIKPMAEVPEAPTGEHAEAMEKTFQDLEKQLQSHEGDPAEKAAEVSKTLTGKIKDYAKATGRSAVEVKNDVMAWSYEHPIVATSLVAGAGVATGVLLSQAGVPEHIAKFAGVAMDVAGDGLDSVTNFAKENPVIAGVVTAGIAAGAGYLIYQAVSN
jgi:ElaB/YqjD/DUF883 family membrane-anchored ribosome-binding protein